MWGTPFWQFSKIYEICTMLAKLGTHLLNHDAIPRHLRSSLHVVGGLSCRTAEILSGSVWIPSSLMTCPRYTRLRLKKLHFFALRRRFAFRFLAVDIPLEDAAMCVRWWLYHLGTQTRWAPCRVLLRCRAPAEMWLVLNGGQTAWLSSDTVPFLEL